MKVHANNGLIMGAGRGVPRTWQRSVHLLTAMLIAVKTGGREVAYVIRSTVSFSLLMLDGRARRTVPSELAPAIATTSALVSNQVAADP